MLQRRQRIHDALRTLGPYVDPVLYQRAREAARAGYVQEDDADGVAGAVAISAALSSYWQGGPSVAHVQGPRGGAVVGGHIEGIAFALHRPRILQDVRRRMTSTESAHHHG
ncbi:DUF6545 domain-containing protein [Streptomyces anthocyanicus]|uniref:DUF6545 domain-containing protein n=1 Tax=Streptomyces anthocyanicus TaxID=68174 RepID=UPI0036E49C6E